MTAPTEKRKRGRPPSADLGKRRQTFRWNDAEWEELQRRAAAAGMNITAYVKSRTIRGD